ncbi:protein glxC [Gluconacetobacter azotocaptans]|uniref:Protein glxC n=1 Tax=Gluconacetobacter azotocaptans TaxID=142834 RepID=A0A7W4PH67_9PROT|nr:protein glxC [Gluconacetobacter azotocaptans]MBB2190786.1 protein glxC [Gluconacetobacter azotocaptans]MBM9400768.1 protein glxC [Gluconacetobacter azotocaptans]GBQ30781.1 glutamate synthase domain 3 [Gluconacetobacter azotocaptans DSM 13594]
MKTLDLRTAPLREINRILQNEHEGFYEIRNSSGQHALAVGLTAPLSVTIDGHAGYYAAGMNQNARIIINGNVGQGVAENMMSGSVHVKGCASSSAGATAQGGLLVIDGDAGARCGISLKGANIVVRGSVGHMSAFMAQSGNLVICGDAGDALGDSLYETRIFVKGKVRSLGADCEEKEMTPQDLEILSSLLNDAGIHDISASGFHVYGSARTLYHFHVDNASAY